MEKKSKIELDIKENRLIRILWISFGFLMVVLGIIGAILPVIPGTVFFYSRSNKFRKKFGKVL